MERADALKLIPAEYGVALRMTDAGASRAEVGAALGVETEAVGPLLDIAEAKLRLLMEDDGGAGQRQDEAS